LKDLRHSASKGETEIEQVTCYPLAAYHSINALLIACLDPCFSENKGFRLIKLDARPCARSKRVDLDLDRIWLYLMELPAAKTVPPLLLMRALNGAPDLECLPLSLLSKRPGLAGGQSEAFRERFSLAR
jgi:hypothetical protein